MIDSERDLDMTLKLTRMLAEPSMADGARVLSAVRSELAMAHGAAAANGAALPGTTVAASRVQPLAVATVKPAAQGAALYQLLAVGVVAAALGFAAGWGLRDTSTASEAAPRERVALPPAEVLEERPTAAQGTPLAETPPAPPTTVLDEATASPEAAQVEPAARPRSRVRKPARMQAAQRSSSALPRSPAQRASNAGPRSPAQDSSEFFEAVNLLRRAQRAVNRGDGQVALSLLAELDTRFDGKTLGEERQATRALALCASADVEDARRVARELARVAPSSIYAGRLRLSCAGWFSANGDPEPRANGAAPPEPVTEPPRP
jgi:hypothetical protein